MTREEYLNQLKLNLTPLTLEEQAEALQYYSDYFEDCNDDSSVMEKLGSPEELARTIVENFANVPTRVERNNSNSNKNDSSADSVTDSSLYYEFKKENVRSINLDFKASDVILISGDRFSVETRGIREKDMECHLSDQGLLTVKNTNLFSFLSSPRIDRIVQRILITVPEKCSLEHINLTVGAGNFRTRETDLHCATGRFDVGAGNMLINSIHGGNISFHCGMGNITFRGTVKGNSSIDCGMGNVTLNLSGNSSDYSYEAKIGLGEFHFNEEKRSGVGQNIRQERKENHFKISVGMGSVNIRIEK